MTEDIGARQRHSFGLDLPPLNESETSFSIAYLVQYTFQARDENAGEKHRALVTAFLRLVEHAIREYKIAYTEISPKPALPSGEVISHYIRSTSNLETCLTAMHRAACFLPKLEELGLVPGAPQPGSVRQEEARAKLRNLRNAVQHLDKRIMNGNLKRAATAPATRDGFLCIGNERVALQTLLEWLSELNRLAALVVYPPPSA